MNEKPIDWAARKERARAYLKIRKVAKKPYRDPDGRVTIWWPDATTYEYDKEPNDETLH
jgi:hypothetical protein